MHLVGLCKRLTPLTYSKQFSSFTPFNILHPHKFPLSLTSILCLLFRCTSPTPCFCQNITLNQSVNTLNDNHTVQEHRVMVYMSIMVKLSTRRSKREVSYRIRPFCTRYPLNIRLGDLKTHVSLAQDIDFLHYNDNEGIWDVFLLCETLTGRTNG